MNILMLGWELPPHNSGGLGVACYHMSKALALKGATIDFIVPYSATHPTIDFMNIHSAVPRPPADPYGEYGAYSASQYASDGSHVESPMGSSIREIQARYTSYVENLVMQSPPDVIHAHDWLTMEAGIRAKELSGAPLIVHVHATEFDRSGEWSGNPVVHEIEEMGLTMADRIIAVSSFTKNIIVNRYGVPADKIEVIHNAIDVAELPEYDYDQSTFLYLEQLKAEGYTIVTTITRFTAQKGLPYLMKAAAAACGKYDRLAFLFVGDGEQRDELIAMSAEFGIGDKVFFSGFLRGKQWRSAYQVADIFIMSSVSEPFGITALEAAHHGCGLIITRQSGVCEVLKSIFRYDFWDVEALADRIVGMALSPALSTSLRQNVAQEYAAITWNDVAEKCMALHRRAVGVASS